MIIAIISYFIVGMVISACIYACELRNNSWVWFSRTHDDTSTSQSIVVVFFWPIGLAISLCYILGQIPIWLVRKIWNR